MQMGNGHAGLNGEVIAVMCFELLNNLFTELTVHACNMFTHLKTQITNGLLK